MTRPEELDDVRVLEVGPDLNFVQEESGTDLVGTALVVQKLEGDRTAQPISTSHNSKRLTCK
jgi:hypothetical protein